ncbi:T9SS type A sorting domain-containing protein [Hymenobacter jeollabukensis]|uniref:T9SS type A sorting domain-containing protein n=1 Tax=Hymenobacter jeollabukensis TaxID=2025313 RepID=A0A5R8WQI2_9BACT|nr:T9SS type A sorting domain-containing protein [Hymenobacter jeollabukensis]TLM93014.1 T9SS type A sorting domain-containing protein [Hymenobacter jeollabukensis]
MQNFTHKVTLLLGMLLTGTLGMAQTTYPTVGIIGSATASGWDASTPMSLVSATDPHNWTITLQLTQNEVKFRANNDWAVNWGAATFPSGTGVANGPNIPIQAAGRYMVRFNDVTGAYQFTVATAAKTASNVLRPALLPNPANGAVRVAYDLPTAGAVTVSVQNMLGQVVRQEAAVRQGAGQQEQVLALAGLAPGLYLVQVQSGSRVETTRLQVN